MKTESKFIKIDHDEFDSLKKEPLWTLFNAILYVNGMRSSEDSGKIGLFIRGKETLVKLALYITQAHKTNKLTLVKNTNNGPFDFGFDFSGSFDKVTEPNYNLIGDHAVEPDQFINFVKNLPLKFPIFDKDARKKEASCFEKPIIETERISLLKMIYGMAIEGYAWDPESSKSQITTEITRDVNQNCHKPITDDTVRKWLKEAKQLAESLESQD